MWLNAAPATGPVELGLFGRRDDSDDDGDDAEEDDDEDAARSRPAPPPSSEGPGADGAAGTSGTDLLDGPIGALTLFPGAVPGTRDLLAGGVIGHATVQAARR